MRSGHGQLSRFRRAERVRKLVAKDAALLGQALSRELTFNLIKPSRPFFAFPSSSRARFHERDGDGGWERAVSAPFPGSETRSSTSHGERLPRKIPSEKLRAPGPGCTLLRTSNLQSRVRRNFVISTTLIDVRFLARFSRRFGCRRAI